MNNIDKDKLTTAINGYDYFNKSQKAIINTILNFEINGDANIAINSVIEITGFSKTIIYKSLKSLEEMRIIKRRKKKNAKTGYIEINLQKLHEILDFHLKKQQMKDEQNKSQNKL